MLKCLTSVLLLMIFTAADAGAKAPNVIVVMADDQGYGDMSCHGNPVVRTPHLDRLHDESIRFSQFHVAPMCTPTRGQLMTGVDALRNGAMNVSSGRSLLKTAIPTLPEHLSKAGFATGLFGKWHLGDNYPFRPQDRGFDEVLWFPSSHIGAVPDHWKNDYFDDTYLHNGKAEPYTGYTTDVFFREAMRWMKEQRQQQEGAKPFFCYLATAAPHGPLYVPKSYRDAVRPRLQAALSKLRPLPPEKQESLVRYLAMIENLDDNLGKLEAFLKTENLREDTVLMFLTDNGSTMGDIYFNAGMRGKKTTLWEGGHRVPLFIRWPNGNFGMPRNVVELTQVQDLLPTVLDLCGAKPSSTAIDGMSLAGLLRGEDADFPDRMLVINYSRMPFGTKETKPESPANPTKEGAAVLWRNWRLIENRELYNLESDAEQKHDVAEQHPEIVTRLRDHLDKWWNGVKDSVNEPRRVVIGSAKENPALLTACEWWNVFVDQQAQVRRGEQKNGIWHLDIAEAGEYEIELRRWPRSADLALSAGLPQERVTDGVLVPGRALAIAGARMQINGQEKKCEVTSDQREAVFQVKLEKGPATLQTWFLNETGEALCGAYYVSVMRR